MRQEKFGSRVNEQNKFVIQEQYVEMIFHFYSPDSKIVVMRCKTLIKN